MKAARLSVVLLAATALSGASTSPVTDFDAEGANDPLSGSEFLRKGKSTKHRPSKAYNLLSAEMLDDLYATVQASNELNGVDAQNEVRYALLFDL